MYRYKNMHYRFSADPCTSTLIVAKIFSRYLLIRENFVNEAVPYMPPIPWIPRELCVPPACKMVLVRVSASASERQAGSSGMMGKFRGGRTLRQEH